MEPNLRSYDFIVVNTSAGKDSQAMLDEVVYQCDRAGVSRGKIVAVHADLGRVEWKGVKELAALQASLYPVRFEVVSRRNGDLLQHVEERGMWPSSAARYCTSDHKRGQVGTLFTRLGDDVRILNCMGMRAQESKARSKLPVFEPNKRYTNSKRSVDTWHPILAWTVDQVWERIRRSGVPYHYAYDLGMPRLSCCFCIFAPKDALMLAGQHNPELLAEYVAVEARIDHSFKDGFKIAEIQSALARGERPGKIQNWVM